MTRGRAAAAAISSSFESRVLGGSENLGLRVGAKGKCKYIYAAITVIYGNAICLKLLRVSASFLGPINWAFISHTTYAAFILINLFF